METIPLIRTTTAPSWRPRGWTCENALGILFGLLTVACLGFSAYSLEQYAHNYHPSGAYEPVDKTNIHHVERYDAPLYDSLQPTLIGMGERWFAQFTATNTSDSVWNTTLRPYKCIKAMSEAILAHMNDRGVETKVMSGFTMDGYDIARFFGYLSNDTTLLVLTNATRQIVDGFALDEQMRSNGNCTDPATKYAYVTAKWLPVGPEGVPFRFLWEDHDRLLKLLPAVATLVLLFGILLRKRFAVCLATAGLVAGVVSAAHYFGAVQDEAPIGWAVGSTGMWLSVLATLYPLTMMDSFRCHLSSAYGQPTPRLLRAQLLILCCCTVSTGAYASVITLTCDSILLRHMSWMASMGALTALAVAAMLCHLLPLLHRNDRVFSRPKPQRVVDRRDGERHQAVATFKNVVTGVWCLKKSIPTRSNSVRRRGVTFITYLVIILVALVVCGTWFGWVGDVCPQTVGRYDLSDDVLYKNHELIVKEFGQHLSMYFLSLCAFPGSTVLADDFITAVIKITSAMEWVSHDVSLNHNYRCDSYAFFNDHFVSTNRSIQEHLRSDVSYGYLFHNLTVTQDERCTTMQLYAHSDPFTGGKAGTSLLHNLRDLTIKNPFPHVIHSMYYGGVQSRMLSVQDQWNNVRGWIHYGSFALVAVIVILQYVVVMMARSSANVKEKATNIMHSLLAVGGFLCPPYVSLLAVYGIFDSRHGQFFFLEATFVVPLTVQSVFIGANAWFSLLKRVSYVNETLPEVTEMLEEITHVLRYTFLTTLRCILSSLVCIGVIALSCHPTTFVWESVALVAVNGACIVALHSLFLPILLRTPVFHTRKPDLTQRTPSFAKATSGDTSSPTLSPSAAPTAPHTFIQ